jgi:hypothetical protein
MALCPVTGSHFTECTGDHNSPRCLRVTSGTIPHPPSWPGYIDNRNDDRDYAEEEHNRRYCDACDSSPCRSDDNHAAEIREEEWKEASSHPSYWSQNGE